MASPEKTQATALRIDKWLWAARFFKTRALATAAIHAGHVKLNGSTVKPARDVRPGDRLDLTIGDLLWTIEICGLNEQRRPASEAQHLYSEHPESVARRTAAKEMQRMAPTPGSELRGRPTKKARRQIKGFNDIF